MTNASTPGSGLRLLSFDGGARYCLFQLYVLREFMNRLEHDLGFEELPYNYFDLIVGVEMGGLVAALLVVFRMSIDDAIETYEAIIRAIYIIKDLEDVTRDDILKKELETLLERRAILPDTLLMTVDSGAPTCKLFLCALNKATLAFQPFRNYAARNSLPSEITIIDALRATCSYSSVRVGMGHKVEIFMNASLTTNNPTREAISEAYNVFGRASRISCVLSLGARPKGQATLPKDAHGPELANCVVTTNGELVANECALQMADLGIYFRFCLPNTTEAVTNAIWAGTLDSTTCAYLQDAQISSLVDQCVSNLVRRQGLTTLDYLYHAGGGLPKLSDHFVMRKQPWLAIEKGLIAEQQENQDDSQRIMVISGMGGSGKTQLARKFAREYKERYQYICFVDGSSPETVEADLLIYVRSLGTAQVYKELRHALGWFIKTKGWLIVFDNVDKPFDLRPFLPDCDHGSILITTRNKSLGDISTNHLKLGVMSCKEAVKALLSAALPAGSTPSLIDLEQAQLIVSELGYLPVAIVQAGSFIRQRDCLPEYLSRLRSSREKILSVPATNQRDQHQDVGIYAVLETTRGELSEKVQKCLHLLSYFHFTNIPYSMILFAIRNHFSVEVCKYLDRPVESANAIELLTDVFGGTDVEELDEVLLSLRNYSLVEIDRISDQKILCLHPLVQAWAQDNLKFEEPRTYRDAAVRLLSMYSGKDNKTMHRLVVPHIRELSPYWPNLHPNDKGAFAELFWHTYPKDAMQLWNEAYNEVKNSPNMDDLVHARLLLKLGKGYYHAGPLSQADFVNKQALAIRMKILGPRHLKTIKAQAHLAAAYFALGRYSDAAKVQAEVLNLRRETLGKSDLDTITATTELALTLMFLGRATEAKPLQEEALRQLLKIHGEEHPDTLTIMSHLARTYTSLKRHADAEPLKMKVLELRTKILGGDHIDTIISSENLAVTYYLQKRYDEARNLQEVVLRECQKIFGETHTQSAQAMTHLGSTYYKHGRIAEAEALALRAEKSQRVGLSPTHVTYKQTLRLLKKIKRRRRWGFLKVI